MKESQTNLQCFNVPLNTNVNKKRRVKSVFAINSQWYISCLVFNFSQQTLPADLCTVHTFPDSLPLGRSSYQIGLLFTRDLGPVYTSMGPVYTSMGPVYTSMGPKRAVPKGVQLGFPLTNRLSLSVPVCIRYLDLFEIGFQGSCSLDPLLWKSSASANAKIHGSKL